MLIIIFYSLNQLNILRNECVRQTRIHTSCYIILGFRLAAKFDKKSDYFQKYYKNYDWH